MPPRPDPERANGDGALPSGLRAVLVPLLERLIPDDEAGPGAIEAGVAEYVEGALAGPAAADLPAYTTGLAAVDAHARSVYGDALERLPAALQDAVVADLERGSVRGIEPSSAPFFELVRRHAAEGMFGDPRWGGNRGEAGWRLLGYPGPRFAWTEGEQALAGAPPAPEGGRPA